MALATFAALLLLPLAAFVWLGGGETKTASPSSASQPSAPSLGAAGAPGLDDEGDGVARFVVGVVLDEDDEPVAGADVALVDHPATRTTSDVEGGFSVSAVPLGAVSLRVTASGFADAVVPVKAGAPGARTRADVRLERLGAIGGVVLTAEGEPAAGAVVACSDRPGEPGLAASSDEQGRFSLSAAAHGCVAVARHRSFADSPEVILQAGDDNRLTLQEAAQIAGVVVDDRGLPVAAFTIGVESYRPAASEHRSGRGGPSQKVDDAQGRFELTGLGAGSYVLTASAAGFPPTQSDRLEVATGERVRGVRVVLSRGGSLVGTVSDAQSREPISGARVALDSATMTRGGSIPAVVTAADGRYQLDGVPTGPFSVRLTADGYVSRVLAGITTEPGRAVQRDVPLTPTGHDERRTEYTGIGAMLAPSGAGIVVGQVIAGGPSEAAGLQARDLILRIDGRAATDLTIPQAVQLLRGPVGTRVSVGVRRGGEERELVITRESFVR